MSRCFQVICIYHILILCLVFWGTVFRNGSTVLYSDQQFTKVPVSSHPHQHLLFSGFFGNRHLNKYEVISHLMFWFPLDVELEAKQLWVSQCVFLLDVIGPGYQCVEWMLEIYSIKRWKRQSQKIKMEVKCWVAYFVLFFAIYPKTFWLRIIRLLAIPNIIVGFKKVNVNLFFFLTGENTMILLFSCITVPYGIKDTNLWFAGTCLCH